MKVKINKKIEESSAAGAGGMQGFAGPIANVGSNKKEKKDMDEWHLNEMTIKMNGEYYILWRAIDAEGH